MSDSLKKNSIAKNTLLLYFRMLITMAVSLYTSRVVLSILGAVDYGIYNVVGGIVTMFTIISGAMTTATQRFLSFEIGKGPKGNISSFFSTAVIIHLFLAIIILFLSETIGVWFLNTHMNFPENRFVAANWVFQFSVLALLFDIISVPYNAAIVAYERMAAFAYVSMIEVSLKLLIVYLLMISSHDKLIVYSILLSGVAVSIRFIYGYYCKKHFLECRCNWHINKEEGGKMISFVSWNMIGSLAGVAKEQGINILLNIFFGAAINAARGIAYQVLGAIQGFVSNFQMAMNPQIIKKYSSGERDSMFKIVFQGSKLSCLMIIILTFPVLIECPYILSIWLKNVPNYTVIFLRLVLITAIIDSLSGTLITSMHASGKVRDYQIVVGGISLLTLPIAYFILKLAPVPYYAMIVGVVITILCLFARLLMLKTTIKFPVLLFFQKVILRVFIVSISSIVLPLICYANLQINLFTVIFVCSLSVLLSVFCSYFLGLDHQDKKIVTYKVRKIFKRKSNE